MSKVAFITDTHLGTRGDSELFANHQMKFYREVFFPLLKQRGITEVYHLGDFFENRVHLKLTTIKNAIDLKELYKDFNVTLLLGNHDVAFKDRNDLNSPEMLLDTPNIKILSEPVELGDFLIIPWINKSNYNSALELIQSSEKKYCLGHFDIIGAKFSKYGEASHEGLPPAIFKNFQRVFSGHYHTKSTIHNIEYLGSPFEYTWSDWDDEKYFHIFDTETGELESIPNPDRIHVKIFSSGGKINIVPKIDKLEGKIVKIETNETDTSALEQVVKLVGDGKAAEIQTIIHPTETNVDLTDLSSIKFDSTLGAMKEYVALVHPDDEVLANYMQELFESCSNAN